MTSRPRWLPAALAAAGAVAVSGLALAGSATTGAASPGPRGTSLAQVAAQPQGLAAEDHTGNDPVRGAAGVPAARTSDAAGHRTTVQGCLLDYGRDGACLPATPPAAADMGMDEASMPWTCSQVRRMLPRGIAVVGKDVLGLDSDHDGTACDSGDAA